jgi:hypothetical protein
MKKAMKVWLAAAVAAGCAAAAGVARAEGTTPQLTTQYGMVWRITGGVDAEEGAPDGGGLASYAGGTETNSWTDPESGTLENVSFASEDGTFAMTFFSYGQPVESDISQYSLGDVIPAPEGAVRGVAPTNFAPVRVGNNDAAYYRNPDGSAIWLPSRDELVAAAGGNLEIMWPGLTNMIVYTVASIPTNRPARIYWTEDPYNAPAVYMSANNQQVYATLHYNNYVTEPTATVTTNQVSGGTFATVTTNFSDGVWFDGDGTSRCLRAEGAEGILLLEYFEDGKYEQSLGVQPVQVLAPTVERVAATVGERLLPVDRYYGTEGLTPKVTAGINGGANSDKMWLVDDNSAYADKRNWLFALRSTAGTPWDAEVYWEHSDARGVTWPFEVDWYEIDWPLDTIRVAIDPENGNGVPAFLPGGIGAEIASQATVEAPKKEAANVDLASDGSSLTFDAPGLALLRYSTQDDFWLEPLQGVRHDDPGEYDATSLDWPIGREILPYSDENYVLVFDGDDDYVEGTRNNFHTNDRPFTIEAWAYRTRNDGTDHPVMSFYQDGGDTSPDAWEMGIDADGNAYFETPAGRVSCAVPGQALREWHHLAGVRTADALLLYVDGRSAASNSVANPEPGAGTFRHIQIGRSLKSGAHFGGRIDEVRYWNEARSAADIAAWLNRSIRGAMTNLLESYPLNEGRGTTVRDVVDGSYGTVYGGAKWIASFHMADNSHLKDLAAYPGYVYSGTAWNVNRYHYPTAWEEKPDSHLFAVNTNHFEIWWGRPSRHVGEMPSAIHYPSLVLNYDSRWPTNAQQIVIASGKGSGSARLNEPSIYVQNDPALPGYNPNEEHAILVGGTAYAIRDDLNAPGGASEPFVLVDTVAKSGRPSMSVFAVVRTNAQHQFRYSTQAGAAVTPPMPLAAWPGCDNTACVSGPGWEDRKQLWWAKAAGDDGGNTNILMRFFYKFQPGFNFPELATQPAEGAEVPWLPTTHEGGGAQGTPIELEFDVSWPPNVPSMDVAQTLAAATGGLPDIWNQASVDIIYQQSAAKGHGDSALLFDPAVEKAVDLEKSVVDELVDNGKARKEATSARYRFGDISPALEERLYYDPSRGSGGGQLVLEGLMHAPLTGTAYILPNWLGADEKAGLLAIGDGLSATAQPAWQKAVGNLPLDQPTVIQPNASYVNAALSSAIPTNKDAYGYVTLAFNNSTNTSRVAPGLPVSLQLVRVTNSLWGAEYLDVIEPDNALEEKLSLLYPGDFGGQAGEYEFEWRWSDPVAGMVPGTPKEKWMPYFKDSPASSSNGAASITIEGGSTMGTIFMLSDHYFAVRYRRADGLGPTSTNWSPWVTSLAPGWIERVMTAINPYDQRYDDMASYAPGLGQTIIEQAGPPYEGAVALNEDAVNDAGLIQVYQTVLDRALSLSLDAGVADSNCNDSLLFAATRLNKLYMALGNEAYADARDPTVLIDPGTGADGWYAGYAALDTSLFCFQNQVTSLLEEELALLRGRDGTGSPAVTVSPVYNRLIWNYTYGIDGGEVAYACNYDIHGDATNTTGVVGAADAKRMYPQGHGDAWGHYLSALAPYYTLLAHTNFGWNTLPGAVLVGNATVGVDYADEEAFALAAAAKARTGADIVSLTARRDYAFGAAGLERWTPDADTNRCWDVDGWAARAGQGAYFDWAVANSLLLDTVTNLSQVGGTNAPATGLSVIDRAHTPAIGGISAALGDIQTRLDAADAGLNPLGLDENAIPFDISAAALDAGRGHFEQMYDRALEALGAARTTFSAAQTAALRLRKQYDSAHDAVDAAEAEEVAFKNRLIEIYGYPYADDIGVSGTYAQGYDGPDLVNYMILDLDETLGPAPVAATVTTTTVAVVDVDAAANASNYYGVALGGIHTNATNTVVFAYNSLGLRVKPSTWTGRRRAQGEIQSALYDFAEQYYAFLKTAQEYQNCVDALGYEYEQFIVGADVGFEEAEYGGKIADMKNYIANVQASVKFFSMLGDLVAETTEKVGEAFGVTLPEVAVGIFPWVATELPKGVSDTAVAVISGIAKDANILLEYAAETDAVLKEAQIVEWETQCATNAALAEIQKSAISMIRDISDQYPLIHELQARLAAMQSALERIKALEAEGERTVLDRAIARNRIAQRLESERYADMMYRTFRNQALERYASMFDVAARRAWLAAMAFDYETGLLDATGNTAASRFLSKIASARALGLVVDGEPQQAGTEGDGGLADALARLKSDWDAVKSRYGIDNPDSATTRFSLRKELFRISPSGTTSDEQWANALATCYATNLNDVDVYRRYCVPYGASTNKEPGLVIHFSGSIVPGANYFGWPVGGGDNFYDPTWLSTRIRAVGVWFAGYNITWNTNNASGAGLANTPNVYLVPAGTDTIVSGADRTRTKTRTWTVLDQILPLPSGLGAADLTPLATATGERRRHSAFRAHHDAGNFTEDELCTNARLIGRSVWNTDWVLIIPGRSLLADPDEGLNRFIHGALQPDGTRDGHGVTDIRLYFQTYSYSGD